MFFVSKPYPPSINFDSAYLVSGRSRNRAKQNIYNVPLSRNAFQLLPGDPEELCRRYVIPPLTSAAGSPPRCLCLENLQREAPRRHPNQIPKPPQLAPFDTKEQWQISELLNGVNSFQPHVSLISFFRSGDLTPATPDQTDPSHTPISPSLLNKTQRYLNSFRLVRELMGAKLKHKISLSK